MQVRARPRDARASALLLLLLVLVARRLRVARRRRGGGSPDAVELKLTDAGCSPATLKLDAGRTTFKVTNAGTGRVSELEVLKGSRILGEKENLVAASPARSR